MRSLVEEVERWAQTHPALFVCGMARSGTTRIYAVFQSSPEFMRASGAVGEAGFFRNYERIDEFRSEQELFSFLDRPEPERDEFDRALALSRPWSPAVRRAFLVRAFFFAAHRYEGMPRLAEKTPGNERWAGELATCLPRSRFLYVQRHPVDVLASIRGVHQRETARGRGASADRAWHYDAERFAEMYRRSVRAFRRMRRSLRGRVAHVAYEDFVAQPEATMRRAFAFAGAAFDPDYLDPRGKNARWGDWEPLLKSPVHRVPSTWPERLTREEVDVVQERLAELMEDVGYEPVPSGACVRASS